MVKEITFEETVAHEKKRFGCEWSEKLEMAHQLIKTGYLSAEATSWSYRNPTTHQAHAHKFAEPVLTQLVAEQDRAMRKTISAHNTGLLIEQLKKYNFTAQRMVEHMTAYEPSAWKERHEEDDDSDD